MFKQRKNGTFPSWADVFGYSIFDRGTKEVSDMLDQMWNGGLFNEIFGGGSVGRHPDVTTDGNTRHYDFEVPGATRDTLHVDLDRNILTIAWTTSKGRRDRQGQYIYVLPQDVDLTDDPVVSLSNGICSVSVSIVESKDSTPPPRRRLPIT